MTARNSPEIKFWNGHLQLLVGRRVTKAQMAYDHYMSAWAPLIRFDDGSAIQLLQDEEGNGPGRFAFVD